MIYIANVPYLSQTDSALNFEDRLISIFFVQVAQVDDSHAFISIHRSQH